MYPRGRHSHCKRNWDHRGRALGELLKDAGDSEGTMVNTVTRLFHLKGWAITCTSPNPPKGQGRGVD